MNQIHDLINSVNRFVGVKTASSSPSTPRQPTNVSWKVCASVIAAAVLLAYLGSGPPKARDDLDYTKVPPWVVFQGAAWLTNVFQNAIDWLKPPALQAWDLAFSLNRLNAVYSCSKAGWPELLASGQKTGRELAAHANISKMMARRLLRTCVALKMFREVTIVSGVDDDNRVYANLPLGDVLRKDHPYSAKAFLSMQVEDFSLPFTKLWDVAGDDNIIPFSLAYNLPNGNDAIWQYFRQNPTQWEQFNRAMTNNDQLSTNAVVYDFPWADKCSTFIDVAGGRGSLLAALLRQAPKASGILFDQPHVIDQAKQFWHEKYQDRTHRVTFHPGSFFKANSIPKVPATAGKNCYITKFIIHDWDDEHAVKILKNVAEAMHPGDRMLIIDMVMSEYERDLTRVLLDIQMRVIGGQERSIAQLNTLVSTAGLKGIRTYPTRSPISVFEAVRPA